MPKGEVSLERTIALMDEFVTKHEEDEDYDKSGVRLEVSPNGDFCIEWDYDNRWFNSLAEVVAWLEQEIASYPETVKVGDYEAMVTAEGIDVGCQHVSFEEFDALSGLVDRLRPKNSPKKTAKKKK